ncbi:MAG: ornithine carbamoyltransferase [Halobacteriaceae archaeon]
MPENLLTVDDLTRRDLDDVLDRAAALKAATGPMGDPYPDSPLARHSLAMLFEKPSTRTRVSFEVGMTQLGGHAVFLSPDDTQLGRGEPIRDTARTLSGYIDAVLARLFDHRELETLARHASVPVINGLTDDAHPCQTLADLLTIREAFGGFEDVSAAWVGDGNNVAQSFAVGCALAGVDLTVATPVGYELDADAVSRAESVGEGPAVTHDPAEAVADVDVVYTDVWVSMGEEDEREERVSSFAASGFQIDEAVLEAADARLMHCLPAHRGEEVTNGAIESERSLVFQQAENRLHAQKGLLVELLR